METLAQNAFGAGSPDVNSVLGKIRNMVQQVSNNNIVDAQAQAFNTVQFVLKKNAQRAFPGGPAAVVALVNGVFCYAGLPFTITDPANSFLIYPSDSAQTVVASTGLAGAQLPANPVSEPTLLTVAPIPFTVTTPGAGPLTTKLDQYPGFYVLEKFSATGAPLTQPIVVGVCPAASVPAAVRPRLRLGHDASYGFELTPRASAGFLDCATATARLESQNGGIWNRVASAFSPRLAYAAEELDRGGVGGLVTELSPFAPVDEEVSMKGGVGGLVTELFRMQRALIAGCDTVETAVGAPLARECRPNVTIKTALGTPLSGAPITFSVQSGGGLIAVQGNAGSCGAFATTVSTVTDVNGSASICWTVGSTPGTNTVRATAGTGGDIPATASINPNEINFSARANAPVGFAFTAQPAAGANIVAGTPFAISANAVDKNGVVALGWSGAVTLSLSSGTFAGGASTLSATAINGAVVFPAVTINAAGSNLRVNATADFFGSVVTSTGNAFNIVPDVGTTLAIASGNGQTAAAGATLPINPTVRVTDRFGNLVSGASISWVAGGSSTGSVSPAANTTGANGQASTSWTVGAGANELRATLARAVGDTMVLFTATGTTASLVALNECAPGGSGDPFNDPANPFGFFLPDPGNGKTIRQIQLYVSSAGRANMPDLYQLRLRIQRGSYDPATSPSSYATANVFLRGNNSESKLVTFVLPTPITGANGPSARTVMLRLEAVTNPDGAKLSFNTGVCSPGKSCKPPASCNVTEVSSPLPYPTGTFYRKSVGIRVLGN
ncbi:MAG: hypothetical protein K2X99_05400 [Gemmatimonadaceae bacterium]|nr:hypothetical protein [Gemmatimonadaceae bacterium]